MWRKAGKSRDQVICLSRDVTKYRSLSYSHHITYSLAVAAASHLPLSYSRLHLTLVPGIYPASSIRCPIHCIHNGKHRSHHISAVLNCHSCLLLSALTAGSRNCYGVSLSWSACHRVHIYSAAIIVTARYLSYLARFNCHQSITLASLCRSFISFPLPLLACSETY